MNVVEPVLSIGQTLQGFTVSRVTRLINPAAIAYEMEHKASGARLIHLHANDSENLFSVTFPTPPPDDTGVPHILEHSVLAGSRKYRVKDPFFEMLKCSMATFINAMTGSDYTTYPVASNVRQDFYNLAEVYWDAVFHPLLAEQTFQREGHHLELAVKGDLKSDLIVKGIVYNEMRGARSSPEAKVYDLIEKNLWPDTPYGKDSGGDPEVIPDLTWQGLRDFHYSYYHPSNAYIFLYGDIPTKAHLEFLGPRLEEFSQREIRPLLPPQPRWQQPRTFRAVYPVSTNESLAGKTFVSLNWLIGSAVAADEVFAFSALNRILLGNQAAPLRKALVDSKLGEDLSHYGFWANGVDSSFHIGLKGSEEVRADQVEKLVLDTLEKIAEQGIAQERFDAAIQQLTYEHLEITPSYPLHLMSAVLSTWQHHADPLELLHAAEHLEKLKRDFAENPKLFSELIRSKLLSNPHRLKLIVRPDPQIAAIKEEAFAEKMRAKKAALSESELRKVARQQEELDAALNAPNSPEALAALPQLQVRDLPAKPRHIPTEVQKLQSGAVLLVNDVAANGVNYLHVSFDLSGLPTELYPYLPLFGTCVQKMGSAGQDYVATAQRVAAFTGGLGFAVGVGTKVDESAQLLRQGTFTTKFLDGNADAALKLLGDVMFSMEPGDRPRLKDVLRQSRAAQRTRPVNDGMSIALRHAARGFNVESHLHEMIEGLPQIHLYEKLAEENPEPLIEKLEAVRAHLRGRARVTASFTGTAAVTNLVRDRLIDWTAGSSTISAQNVRPAFEEWKQLPREGLAAPMNVAFCTAAMPAPHISHRNAPGLAVAGRLLSLGYVLEEVRFKGTAYGGGCGYNGTGKLWVFHSYRDPWILRTLDVYENSLAYIRKSGWSQADVDRAIIGAAKAGEKPIRPSQSVGDALARYLSGDTRELREARHTGMLETTLGHVQRVLEEQFETHAKQSAICVVSSQEKLEEANRQRPEQSLEIQNILAD